MAETDYPNGLDLEDEGSWPGRFWKWVRGTFLLNWLLGWHTYDRTNPERTCTGHLSRLTIAGDGDINIYVTPEQCQNLLNPRNNGRLVCEIPLADRRNFNNLHQLQVCRRIEIRGRYVRDRSHGWNELHPVSAITILN